MKRAINLLIVAAILWAGFHAAPPLLHNFQFQDGVEETARFAGRRSDAEVRDRVIALAAQYEIPLDAEAIEIRREGESVEISAPYVERVQLLPGYYYDWHFSARSAPWRVAPTPNPRRPPS